MLLNSQLLGYETHWLAVVVTVSSKSEHREFQSFTAITKTSKIAIDGIDLLESQPPETQNVALFGHSH